MLRRLGVTTERRVVLLLPDGPEFVASFWGALKIGAVPVPTNTLLKPRDYEYILKDSRATVVIAGESLVAAVEEVRPRLPDLTHVVVVGRPAAGQLAYGELVGAERPELAPAATTRDDVAFWQYTSGTTGVPKAAVHLHHDMLICCEAYGRHVLEIRPEDRTFSVAKLFFAYGLGNALYFPFHVGASTVLYPGRPEPAKVFETIAREPGYDAKIVDDEGREVATGEVGNLLVKGDSACAGYWNQHDRTKQTIAGEWLRTGDKYRRDADGYFWYAGRADDMIKAGGIWVSPTEVESALAEHPAVVGAGVVGAPDRDELVKPLAFVVLVPGHAPTPALEEELKAFVKSRLAPYKYPRWIVFVPELPKTATGKIQRFKLREIAAQTPRTPAGSL